MNAYVKCTIVRESESGNGVVVRLGDDIETRDVRVDAEDVMRASANSLKVVCERLQWNEATPCNQARPRARTLRGTCCTT